MMRAILAALLLFAATAANAATRPTLDPKIGSQIDLTLPFGDASGHEESLGDFTAAKPALLLLGYHRCPNLCGVAQLDLAEALKATGLPPNAYTVLFISIDPAETTGDARDARQRLAAASDLDLRSWRFLTGSTGSIATLEGEIGMTAVQPAEQALFIHPVAVSAITADGRLSRVLQGLDYPARDLRLAVVEASEGKLGTLGEHILLICSGFDPATGKYTSSVMVAVRIGGFAALAALAGGVLLMLRRERA
jgi:protein SCO1/2